MSDQKKIELKIKIKSLSFLLFITDECGVKKKSKFSIFSEEFVSRINQLTSNSGVTEILDALELIKDKFQVEEELTRREWYEVSGMGRIASWRKWKWAINSNSILAQNYLDFGNKKQKHKLDGYQRFLLCFVKILLLMNRSYDSARIFLSEERNYQQITRRKFVDWFES